MGRINIGRVILAGIIAGVAMDIYEGLVNGFIEAPYWAAAMGAINKAPYTTTALILFNVWGLIWGLTAAWVYAAIRPRFGAGHKTAIIAGLTMWVAAYVLGFFTLAILTIIPWGMMVLITLIGLVGCILASLAGNFFYKEE